MEKRYLHIGCGNNILPKPFENMDIRSDLKGVDHIGEVYPLKFENDTFDLLYSSHVLEHFERVETKNVLKEWIRVIKPGGKLRLSVPSFENMIKIYKDTGDIDMVMGPIMGGQTYPQNFHYMLFDKKNIESLLKECGLIAIHLWDYRRTEHREYWDFSQAETNGVLISINIEASKPVEMKEVSVEPKHQSISVTKKVGNKILVTGSGGLIGSEACRYYLNRGFDVIGIDNDFRKRFFGPEGSTSVVVNQLKEFKNYTHKDNNIVDDDSINKIFREYGDDIGFIIHTAAQPSHDWAIKEPKTDFEVNARGTLNLLEGFRTYCSSASFIFTSTNKVYGDKPNVLKYDELEQRFEYNEGMKTDFLTYKGFNEYLSIDSCLHSLFGVSKLSADLMVQEYGKYFGLNTVCFRGGCLTGPKHSGVELHGFLSYLIKCIVSGKEYNIFGYKGKQVRDNIHATDLISSFEEYRLSPRSGEVYNIGGGRHSNCSMLEAISIGEEFIGKKLKYKYVEDNRVGDHIWWISDTTKFESHYPNWKRKYNINQIIGDIADAAVK